MAPRALICKRERLAREPPQASTDSAARATANTRTTTEFRLNAYRS